VLPFINDLRCSVGAYVYRRRIYETMAGWQTDAILAGQSGVRWGFAHLCEAADRSSMYPASAYAGGFTLGAQSPGA
jgi:hypothetical protein